MSPFNRALPFAAAIMLFALAACTPQSSAPTAATTKLDSDRARASYVVGLDLAESVTPLRGQVDIDTVILALRTAHAGGNPLMAPDEVDAARKQFTQHLRDHREAERKALAATNLQSGDVFLGKNRENKAVQVTASGLQYEVLVAAEGVKPIATDSVRVHYIGKHLDGSEFENTYATDHPAEFVLNQVMPGWIEGIGLMSVGSKYRFWLPAKLAFGEHGLSDQVEPNETLMYEVELLEIAGR